MKLLRFSTFLTYWIYWEEACPIKGPPGSSINFIRPSTSAAALDSSHRPVPCPECGQQCVTENVTHVHCRLARAFLPERSICKPTDFVPHLRAGNGLPQCTLCSRKICRWSKLKAHIRSGASSRLSVLKIKSVLPDFSSRWVRMAGAEDQYLPAQSAAAHSHTEQPSSGALSRVRRTSRATRSHQPRPCHKRRSAKHLR